ncbi:hypothetical protein RUM44_006303 [Polyplax serrata]|uniref:Uncharacterized protein n=1 Tax=Polyplax serrata TaxID=468196 RepID=A0ABR1AHQ5_POLSC
MLDRPQPINVYEGNQPDKNVEISELKQSDTGEMNDSKEDTSTEFVGTRSRHHSPTGNVERQSRPQSPVIPPRVPDNRLREKEKEGYDSDESREENTSRETVLPVGELTLKR